MIFGKPTTIPKLLDFIEAQIAADMGVGRNYVFTSLAEDSDLLEAPPNDRFVAIRPGRFPVDTGTTSGGGRGGMGFNSTWRIALFARLNQDQELRSDQLLRSTQGPLAMVWRLLGSGTHGIQLFIPLDDNEDCVLREPGRLVQFDLDAKKILDGKGKTWWVIPTYWEFKFTADITLETTN